MSKVKDNLEFINEKKEIDEFIDYQYRQDLSKITKEQYIDLAILNYPKDVELKDLTSDKAYEQFKSFSMEDQNKIFPLQESDFATDKEFINSLKLDDDLPILNEERETNIEF